MKSVLIASDLIKDLNGNIKVIETNTNASVSINWNLYDFANLQDFIQSNNFTEVNGIVPQVDKPFSAKIKEICDSIGITYVEHITVNGSITVPFIEDNESTLIIRLSYDTTAVVDDQYCRDKFALQKVIHNESFGVKTYIPVEVDGVTIDDFTEMEDFVYTNDIPNFIVKSRYPNYDKEVYPKLYKVENLTQLNALKSTIESDYYLQEFIQSELIDGRRNIIRSLDLLYGSNLDTLNIGGYTVLNQIEETIWNNTWDENNMLAKKDRPKYITHTAGHDDSSHEYVYDVDQDVAMMDGSRKTFYSLILGDSIKSLHIQGLDLDESTYQLQSWTGTYSDFIENFSIISSAVVATRESQPVSQLFIKITMDDGTEWDDVKLSPLLVKDGDVIKFKRVNDMAIGDVIITYNFESSEVELKTIQNMEIIFKENQILGSLDVEPVDLYLPFVSANSTVIQHNRCTKGCASNACFDSFACGNCSFYVCNK